MDKITFLLEMNLNWIELKRKYGIDRPGGELGDQAELGDREDSQKTLTGVAIGVGWLRPDKVHS